MKTAGRRSRAVALTATATTLALTLAACGADAEEQSEAAATASAPDTPAATAASGSEEAVYPVTVTDDFGAVEVPEAPERIVTLVDYAADLLASFDRVPVAAQVGTSGTRPVYLGQEYADLPSVGAYAEPSLESIVDQEPDLVIGLTAAHGELRQQLSEIAPTVVLEPRSYQDVLGHVDTVGTLLGEPERALSIAEGLQEDVAALQGDVDATCLLTNSNGQGISIMPLNTVAPSVLAEYCDYAYDQEAETNSVESSVEAVLELDPEYLFVAAIVPEGASAVEALAADPLWGQLRAVREGNVVEVDPTVWLYGRGPNAIERVIAESAAQMAGGGS